MHNLGCCYEEQQRFDVGMIWFDIVIKLKPLTTDAYHGFALCAFKSGKEKLAIEYLDDAIK